MIISIISLTLILSYLLYKFYELHKQSKLELNEILNKFTNKD